MAMEEAGAMAVMVARVGASEEGEVVDLMALEVEDPLEEVEVAVTVVEVVAELAG